MNPLREIRQSIGYTQAQMAEALDVSLRAYAENEARADPRRLMVLAAQQVRHRLRRGLTV